MVYDLNNPKNKNNDRYITQLGIQLESLTNLMSRGNRTVLLQYLNKYDHLQSLVMNNNYSVRYFS